MGREHTWQAVVIRGILRRKGGGGDRFHMNTNTSAAPLMFCNVLLPCLFNTHSLPERNEGVNECLVKLIKNLQDGFALSVVFLLTL